MPRTTVAEQSGVATRPRALRADAQRNREALLSAATAAYAERGTEASLEDIARRAGVGIGTLYRHFPNRDVLNEALYRRNVEVLCDAVPGLLAERTADEALSEWIQRFAEYVVVKKGMAAALKPVLGSNNELFAYTRDRLHGAVQRLLDAAAAAGSIRPDVSATELLRGMGGICMANDGQPDRHCALSMMQLLIDGLRYGAPAVG